MDEFDIDDSLDTLQPEEGSSDVCESVEDGLSAMDMAETPSFDNSPMEELDAANLDDYTSTSIDMVNDEVYDVMNDVEAEELTFEDEAIENYTETEQVETNIESSFDEANIGTFETMDNVEPESVDFEEQVVESVDDAGIELLQEDEGVELLENIPDNVEIGSDEIESVQDSYEAVPNSEIEILQEDGSVENLENIQNEVETDSNEIDAVQGSYEATPNSGIEILQEDGSVETLENIQDEVENVQDSYEAASNSDVDIFQDDQGVESLDSIQEQLDSVEISELNDEGISEYVEEQSDVLDVPEQLDPHEALSNMSEYMNAHNYGLDDYETYSKDPEWQALNRDLQIANGIEPMEYVEEQSNAIDAQEQLDPHEALSNMSEYMNAHNYGLDDYETYSKDPEWQALNRDLQVANGIEPTEYLDIDQNPDHEIEPRSFDDFEQSVLEKDPEFYDSGSFYEQGVNEFGYQGTCGPTSQANALNQLFGTNELTENKVLSVAIENNLCQTHGSLDSCGGTSTEQFMELYDKMNEQLGDKFDTELYEYDRVLDANQVAERLESGSVVNVAVDACALWDQPREYTNALGVRQDDFYSDHWITVTGVERTDEGVISGFDIIDSGGGENYVSLDKYNDMCFGTNEHRVIDPTCIVVSRKEGVEGIGLPKVVNETDSVADNEAMSEVTKKPNLFDRIFHRKGED